MRKLGGGRRATAPEATGDLPLPTYGPTHAPPAPRAVAALLLVVLAACGDSGSDDGGDAGGSERDRRRRPRPKSTKRRRPPRSSSRTTTLTAAPSLELLEEGAEPSVELRYAFEDGSSRLAQQHHDDRSDHRRCEHRGADDDAGDRVHRRAGRRERDRDRHHLRHAAPSKEGRRHQRRSSRVPARGSLRSTEPPRTLRASSVGEVIDLDLQLAPGAPASVEQFVSKLIDSFEQQTVAFPVEAVGVGARWRDDDRPRPQRPDRHRAADLHRRDDRRRRRRPSRSTLAGTFGGAASGRSNGAGTARVSFDSFFPTARRDDGERHRGAGHHARPDDPPADRPRVTRRLSRRRGGCRAGCGTSRRRRGRSR